MRQAIYRVALLPLLLAVLLAYNASAQESAQMADCAKRAGTAIDGVSVERIAGECARNPDLPRCRLLGRRHTRAMSLQRVENYLQFNAPGLDGAPTSQQAWADAAQQKYDMFIDDYYSGHCAFDPADVHAFQDSRPPRGRLAIAVERPDGMSGISVTPEFLAHVEKLVFVVAGGGKHDAIRSLMNNDPKLTAWRAVQGVPDVELWVEQAALSSLMA